GWRPPGAAGRAPSAGGALGPPRAATVQPLCASASPGARPLPPAAPVTITRRRSGEVLAAIARVLRSCQPVSLPVPVGNVGRILVPVPRARVTAEVVGRIACVQRVPDPPGRK